MAVCDPDTKQVIPKGTASLVDWVKTTVRSVSPENWDWGCPFSLQMPSGAPLMRQMIRAVYKPGWDYLYDNVHLLNMPVTPLMVNAVFNGNSYMDTP